MAMAYGGLVETMEEIREGQNKIYSISELNKASRLLLEGQFNTIQVEGEVSNLVCASSGHHYYHHHY